MKERDEIAAELRKFRDDLDPVAASSRLDEFVAGSLPPGPFAEAAADLLVESTNSSDAPTAFESALLAHLTTLSPFAESQLLRTFFTSRSCAVVEAVSQTEQQMSDSSRFVRRLGVELVGAGSEEVFGRIMEDAMIRRHRWTFGQWRDMVWRTESSRRAACRLVWTGSTSSDQRHFRVTPEGEFLDESDEPFAPETFENVTLRHTLDFQRDEVEKWGRIFAEYDIVALFSQFDRTVAAPPASWEKRDAVPIHQGAARVPTWLHFVQGGWAVRRIGSRSFFDRELASDVLATVSWHGSDETAHLIELYFATGSGRPLYLGDIPAIAYSEALLTLSELERPG